MSARSRFLLGGDVFLIQFAVKQIVRSVLYCFCWSFVYAFVVETVLVLLKGADRGAEQVIPEPAVF